jgi:hypothetical protein
MLFLELVNVEGSAKALRSTRRLTVSLAGSGVPLSFTGTPALRGPEMAATQKPAVSAQFDTKINPTSVERLAQLLFGEADRAA